MAHSQIFFMHNLPALTDFGKVKDDRKVIEFLEDLVFTSLFRPSGKANSLKKDKLIAENKF